VLNLPLEHLPTWLWQIVWTLATIGAAYLAGLVISAVAAARLDRLAARTNGQWDDVLTREIRRRVPFWAVLVGASLSLMHWPQVSPQASQLVTRLISAIGVLSVTFASASVAARLVALYGSRLEPSRPVSGLMQNVTRIVVVVIGLLVVVKALGYEITPMVAALGVGGLAVALALQEPLSSLFAGIFITLARQVRIGDYIRLDTGAEGEVVDFNWRSASLRQLPGNLVIVPNSKLAQAIVTNFSLPSVELGTTIDVVVDRESDLGTVERLATEVAREVTQEAPGAVHGALPAVRFAGYIDRGVLVHVTVRTRAFADQLLVRHECIKRLHARLAREGVKVR
jgi:small-conductance mechanosensitive channel